MSIKVNPKVLTTLHFAVFGSTGSGKSYTVGVLIEELLRRRYPVIVFDPHGEYRTFSQPNIEESGELSKHKLRPASFPVKVFSLSGVNGERLSMSLRSADFDILTEMMNLTPVMKDLLFLAYRKLKNPNSFEELLSAVEEVADTWGFQKRTKLALARNLALLDELGVFGEGIDPAKLVVPGRLTVIDLSEDYEESVKRAIVGFILAMLFRERKKGNVKPFLAVIEEAHRFAPQEEDTVSKNAIRRIAREGRKFGVAIGLVSQRIVGLDKDAISQCGTKFIMRIDSKTDLDYLRPYLELASDEDVELIPYLPTGVALITGMAVSSLYS